MSHSRQVDRRERRPAPPPKEADDRLVTAVGTACWAVAFVVLLVLRSTLPGDARWWLWTCVAGLALGLFALWYVPFLQNRRARIAARHAGLPRGDDLAYPPEASPVTAEDTGPAGTPAFSEPTAPAATESG